MYDDDIPNKDQMDKWEVWYNEVAISCIMKYYKKHKDNSVIVHHKGDIGSSVE